MMFTTINGNWIELMMWSLLCIVFFTTTTRFLYSLSPDIIQNSTNAALLPITYPPFYNFFDRQFSLWVLKKKYQLMNRSQCSPSVSPFPEYQSYIMKTVYISNGKITIVYMVYLFSSLLCTIFFFET